MSSFIQLCINGDALLEDIDDFVDSWHDGDSELSLAEFLGMSNSEYNIWLREPDILPIIIKAKRDHKDSASLMNEEVYHMAARSGDVVQSEKLKSWLIREGLWKGE